MFQKPILLAAMLAIGGIVSFFKTECDPNHGTAKKGTVEYQLNPFKNRQNIPFTIDSSITLQRILLKGNDTDRFKNSDAVTISGYVVGVKLADPESCNCESKEEAKRDIHLELAENKNESDRSKVMVIEVTPEIRARNGWTFTQLKMLLNSRVEFTGWMMFDVVHANVALNTVAQNVRIERATAWEVHPVTSYKILSGI